MNPEDVVLPVCLGLVVLSAAALALLANPRSFLSRLVDRPVGDTTDRKALR